MTSVQLAIVIVWTADRVHSHLAAGFRGCWIIMPGLHMPDPNACVSEWQLSAGADAEQWRLGSAESCRKCFASCYIRQVITLLKQRWCIVRTSFNSSATTPTAGKHHKKGKCALGKMTWGRSQLLGKLHDHWTQLSTSGTHMLRTKKNKTKNSSFPPNFGQMGL